MKAWDYLLELAPDVALLQEVGEVPAVRFSEERGNTCPKWEWLWDKTEYSRDALAARSGLSRYGLDRCMSVLVGNRILYPDGRICSFVQRYLRDRVLQSLESRSRKAPSRSK